LVKGGAGNGGRPKFWRRENVPKGGGQEEPASTRDTVFLVVTRKAWDSWIN
jgi:hypothetical protein